METTIDSPAMAAPAPKGPAAPIPFDQRIAALDVVRGFALLGIFLMNIEWFSRSFGTFGLGIPPEAKGLDFLADYFVNYFVQGKFWTIFSLLFGMGFAVMLVRLEASGRDFVPIYLRRILALATFGAFHYIFIWPGDILFSYAVGAGALLIVLYGRWQYMLAALIVLFVLSAIPYMGGFGGIAGGLLFVSLVALYLRGNELAWHVASIIMRWGGALAVVAGLVFWVVPGLPAEPKVPLLVAGAVFLLLGWLSKMYFTQPETRVQRSMAWPLASVIMLVGGGLATLAAIALWLIPNAPEDPRAPTTVLGSAFLILGILSVKYYQPKESRSVRAGVTLFLLTGYIGTGFGLIQYLQPPEEPAPPAAVVAAAPAAAAAGAAGDKAVTPPVAADAKTPDAKAPEAKPADAKAADVKADTKADAKTANGKKAEAPVKTKAQKDAERRAQREKRIAEQAKETQHEVDVLTKGSYYDTVMFHAEGFLDKAVGDAGFAGLLIGMFLLGMWFVRSGIMENTGAHLDLFRKMAYIGLPVGVGLGVLSSLIAVSHIPGAQNDGWGLARGIKQWGDLPACLGYVGMIVLMLHSKGPFSNVKVLAPLGRMALTNYLTQSTLCCLYFYGYGLGHWGMPRSTQMLFVAVVYIGQIMFSHWWLARFRYGPMEWLWRGFTYRQIPPLRIAPAGAGALRAAD